MIMLYGNECWNKIVLIMSYVNNVIEMSNNENEMKGVM
jgi:hypothetical protein